MPVDLSGSIHASLEKALSRAKLYQEKGQAQEAASAYSSAAKLMKQYAQYAGREERVRRLKRAKEYQDLAARLASGDITLQTSGRLPEAKLSEGKVPAEEYESAISQLVHKSKVRWSDIGGLEETKKEIKSAYGLTLAQKPQGVKLEGWRNIMFYGPPGTGKTLLAAATSNGLEATFFNVKIGNLLSKYFGESTKLITALYDTARKTAPSVIFLDEFDALSGKRGNSDSGAERRILSTILAELDGLAEKGSNKYVLTIAATNAPWLMDEAVLSRFEKKIYIPLPDTKARKRIMEIHLREKGHGVKVSYEELAEKTEGYSGREMEQLGKEVINIMISNMNPDIARVVDKGKQATEGYKIKVRPLTKSDFEKALSEIKLQTTQADLERFKKWRTIV